MARSRVSADLDRRVRDAAGNRCGYCQSPQHLVMAPLEIEHIIPLAHDGTDIETNLWLACPLCNSHKSDKMSGIDSETGQSHPLFNPRTQQWNEHFRWSEDGIRVIGLTPTGRATVNALHLNDNPYALIVRSNWVVVGWHPPND